MDRYRCPTVAKSWRRGTMSRSFMQRRGPADGGQALGVVQVHALRAFQEHEVPQRLLAERQQRQLHPCRVVAGGRGQVRPGQVRRGADGRQQVLHQRQVQHLLRGHVRDLLAPALHRGQLGPG